MALGRKIRHARSTITAGSSSDFTRKKPGSVNSACRARSDSCIRQCRPTTAQLCLQHQHTGNNLSLSLQLFTEKKLCFLKQESKGRKVKTTGVVQGGTMSIALFNYYLADFSTPPPNIKLNKYANDITIYTSGPVVADPINGINIYLSQVLNYIENKKTDSDNGHIHRNTFHARYSRAPLASTSEVGQPSTTARKEAKSVRSDARHPAHYHTTLQIMC